MLTLIALHVLLVLATASAVCGDLNTPYFKITPNGFKAPPRGWNTFALQALEPSFNLNQANVITQCDALAERLGKYGYEYCSLDSGWSVGDEGDEYGRIQYDKSKFDIPSLATHLHSKNLKLGVYILPGYFNKDGEKTIYGTNPPIKFTQAGAGTCNDLARCAFNYQAKGAQEYCNSVVNKFASWGVDFIKLDFVTPGSPDNGAKLEENNSGSVPCYHKAIAQSGRQMRLDISWKLDRNEPYYSIWSQNADSMRIDQDLNNAHQPTLVSWGTVQRAIEQYRQYINQQVPKGRPLTIYPDMDNLLVGNSQSLTGLSDRQRQTVMTHWIGAAANLILGSDLTQLDQFGINLLTNQRALDVATFTASNPMRPLLGNDKPDKGSPLQVWLAGPGSTSGVAVIVLANYGASGTNSLFNPAPAPGKQGLNFTLESLGLSQDSYQLKDIWKPQNDKTVSLTDVISVDLDDGESIFWKLLPQGEPTTKTATEIPITTMTVTGSGTQNTGAEPPVLIGQPTGTQTRSALPIASLPCGNNKLGPIPSTLAATDAVIPPKQLLYRMRQMICNGTCSSPEGIPPATVAIAQDEAKNSCEISVGVSQNAEAYMYRTTPPTGDQWQQCWDSTMKIIEDCIGDSSGKGWWNGNHDYQFYEAGFRALNDRSGVHISSSSSITSTLPTSTPQ
ncbi:MAG: hypothetical protein M1840_005203 [Geoglossum simile]|nr:MAG: hypothetical protein M1840_005203 [Geoglossum simile]